MDHVPPEMFAWFGLGDYDAASDVTGAASGALETGIEESPGPASGQGLSLSLSLSLSLWVKQNCRIRQTRQTQI